MKGLDIFVVRFMPFALYIILCANIRCAWEGIEEVTIGYELHGNSALYAAGFFLVSLSNRRYHCIWNRVMYIYLILIPIFNFLEACFEIVPNDRMYIHIIWATAVLAALGTAFLAIRHFVLIAKKRITNEERNIRK